MCLSPSTRNKKEMPIMPNVFVSSVIDAPLAEVWATIRDFNALPNWHPAIAESRIEHDEPSDRVGCVRNFRLTAGGTIREQLLALDDVNHVCVYSILESPMPVDHYVATLRLLPVTDGRRTYAEWSAQFNCPQEHEQALVLSIGQNVFQTGLNALKQRKG
jgi:hypothetical protein